MKSLARLITVLFCAMLLFTGCQDKKTPKELIVKKWKLHEISRGQATGMPDSMRQKLLANMAMEFTPDNKYILTGMDLSTQTGTYSISDDELTLTIVPDRSGKPEKNTLNEITADRLIITDEQGTRLESVPK